MTNPNFNGNSTRLATNLGAPVIDGELLNQSFFAAHHIIPSGSFGNQRVNLSVPDYDKDVHRMADGDAGARIAIDRAYRNLPNKQFDGLC